ncbi:MAG: hypothetical protein AAGK97_06660 [Bacteroidota bacterium]
MKVIKLNIKIVMLLACIATLVGLTNRVDSKEKVGQIETLDLVSDAAAVDSQYGPSLYRAPTQARGIRRVVQEVTRAVTDYYYATVHGITLVGTGQRLGSPTPDDILNQVFYDQTSSTLEQFDN